jgi:hypothetical protein
MSAWQPFNQRTSTEVRLVVDDHNYNTTTTLYRHQMYNADIHDQCMFHHNSISRTHHAKSGSKIQVGREDV